VPTIAADDLCPCESGRTARGCCFFGGKALAREADTQPAPPLTGVGHPGCYAASLSDCAGDLTNEHYFSETVLREMAGKSVFIRGFPWQTEPMRVGVASLAAKILCARHNSALSGLDSQAARFFRAVQAIERALDAGVEHGRVILFAGVDIERWMLKALIGMASAGAARAAGAPIAWTPPRDWLRVLFAWSGFPASWGLYVSGRLGDRFDLDSRTVSISPLLVRGALAGLEAKIAGLRVVLVMHEIRGRATGAIDDESIRRPDELLFTDVGHSLCFTWTTGRGGGQVRFGKQLPSA
jgi:hypothetical protein